jgi:Xaa-Pro aminopeptidase
VAGEERGMTMFKNGYAPSDVILEGHSLQQYPYYRTSDSEFAARRTKIQGFMAERGLDCLLIAGGTATWDRNWTNTRWAVGHIGCLLTPSSYVVYPAEGEPTVLAFPIIAMLPARRAREVVEDVRAAPEPDLAAVERLKELGLSEGRVGIVETDLSSSIPLPHWRTFQRELPNATIEFVTREWWRQVRFIRSEEEIVQIEQAARIGDLMSAAIAEDVHVGLPEREVFTSLASAMVRNGGDYPSQILVASAPTATAFDTYQRERPMNRIIEQGDMLLAEYAPRWPTGAECQTGRTFFFGKPHDRYRRMAEVMLEAYDAVVDALQPGMTDEDILKAADVISDAGYIRRGPLIHGAEGGASGSLPMVAPPVAVKEAESFEVVPGIVLCVEIHVAEADNSGVFMSDTFVTTDGPARCLNAFPREPLIL